MNIAIARSFKSGTPDGTRAPHPRSLYRDDDRWCLFLNTPVVMVYSKLDGKIAMGNIDPAVKQYLKEWGSAFVQKLDEKLQNQIVDPMTTVVNEVKALKKKVDDGGSSLPRQQSSFSMDMVDPALNLISSHIEETIGFTLLMVSMIKGKVPKEPRDIAERILNDYGSVAGKHLARSMDAYLKTSKEKKLASAWAEVLKHVESA